MEKYLYFMEQTDNAFDAAQDAVCYPLSSFQGFSANGTINQFLMHFSGVLGQDEDAYDVVTLTMTSNNIQKEVMEALTDRFNAPMIPGDGKQFIVVADDSNSVFADSRISGCLITTTAVD